MRPGPSPTPDQAAGRVKQDHASLPDPSMLHAQMQALVHCSKCAASSAICQTLHTTAGSTAGLCKQHGQIGNAAMRGRTLVRAPQKPPPSSTSVPENAAAPSASILSVEDDWPPMMTSSRRCHCCRSASLPIGSTHAVAQPRACMQCSTHQQQSRLSHDDGRA